RMFEGVIFNNPEYFYLLLAIIPMVAWYILRQKKNTASIQVSSAAPVFKAPKTMRLYLRHLVLVLEVLAFAAFTAVLARPQSSTHWENVTTEGIDIVISLDVSTSMLAKDFIPDRLEAAKKVAMEF